MKTTLNNGYRPYFRYSLKELINLSKNNETEKQLIEQIIHELTYRKTKATKILLTKLRNPESVSKQDIQNKDKNNNYHEIIKAINSGIVTKKEILTKFNLTPEALSRLQQEAYIDGINLKRIPSKGIAELNSFTKEGLDQIYLSINLEKFTKKEILTKFNLTPEALSRLQRIARIDGVKLKRFPKNSSLITEKEQKILQLRASGLTLEEIGKQFSVTRERIRQILTKIERKGFKVPKSATKIKKASASIRDKQLIKDQVKTNKVIFIKEYKKNLSDKQTAKNLGLSLKVFKAVLEILIKDGQINRRLKIFNKKKYIEMKKEWGEIAAMRKAGYNNQKIADIFGVSSIMISIKIQRMKSNGYDIQPYGLMKHRDYSNDHDEETLAYRTRSIRDLNNQGFSKVEIATKIGLSYRDLFRHIELFMIDY